MLGAAATSSTLPARRCAMCRGARHRVTCDPVRRDVRKPRQLARPCSLTRITTFPRQSPRWRLSGSSSGIRTRLPQPHPPGTTEWPTKLLGKADRIDIFVFEEFSHESGRKPLSHAQIRRLEVPVSLFSPKHRPSEPPKHLFQPPFSPATHISPSSGPATGSFNGIHPKSIFLAISWRREWCHKDEGAMYVDHVQDSLGYS